MLCLCTTLAALLCPGVKVVTGLGIPNARILRVCSQPGQLNLAKNNMNNMNNSERASAHARLSEQGFLAESDGEDRFNFRSKFGASSGSQDPPLTNVPAASPVATPVTAPVAAPVAAPIGTPAMVPTAPIPTMVIEPESVPEVGKYEFIVTGSNFSQTPGFLLSCPGADGDLELLANGNPAFLCSLAKLKRFAADDDGGWTITVTYNVPQSGLVLAAGDMGGSNGAAILITVGANAPVAVDDDDATLAGSIIDSAVVCWISRWLSNRRADESPVSSPVSSPVAPPDISPIHSPVASPGT